MILTPTGNWMSTPAMIINASVPPPPATTQHTLITLSNTRENRNIRSEKLRKGAKSENKLAFVHLIYSEHFLPPTCGPASRCEWSQLFRGAVIKMHKPRARSSCSCWCICIREQSRKWPPSLVSNRALWMMIVNWPTSAPRCNRDNKDNGGCHWWPLLGTCLN